MTTAVTSASPTTCTTPDARRPGRAGFRFGRFGRFGGLGRLGRFGGLGRFGKLVVGSAIAVTAVVATAGTAAATTVTVQPGGDLFTIAAQYGTTVSALEAANGITNPNLVYAGAVLQIPGSPGTPPPATTVTLQAGDNLTQLASQYNTTVAVIDAANGIANPNLVYAGTTLKIPASTPSPTGARTPAPPTTVVVGLGQTLTSIAATYNTTVADLVSENDITNPNFVTAGTLLRLPSTWVLADYGWPSALVNDPAALALVPDFMSAAKTYNVPLSLLEAMCWWESGWQATVTSPTGAVGECQLEPYTTAFVNSSLLGGANLNPLVPAQNIELAAAFLGDLLAKTSDNEHLALAGYYQGLLSVQQNGMLSSTQTYVQGILGYSAIFAAG